MTRARVPRHTVAFDEALELRALLGLVRGREGLSVVGRTHVYTGGISMGISYA